MALASTSASASRPLPQFGASSAVPDLHQLFHSPRGTASRRACCPGVPGGCLPQLGFVTRSSSAPSTALANIKRRVSPARLSPERARVHQTRWSECDFSRVSAPGWSEVLAHVWAFIVVRSWRWSSADGATTCYHQPAGEGANGRERGQPLEREVPATKGKLGSRREQA